MIEISELTKFINHKDFTPELAKECISVYNEKNILLGINELGDVFQQEKNTSFDDYELLNPSAVIEFYKESLIEKNNDTPELKNKINLLDDIQDYCVEREENEAEFEREITYSNKSKLDLQEGFWTTTDGYKTKVHISTNYLSDKYVRLITNYENRNDEIKNYIDNLIAANPNESYITISINPTTKEIEFNLGIYNGNFTDYLKYNYKFQLIKDLGYLLYYVDTIDNATTNEYKQQIGSNFEKYKEIVDSVIVEALTNSIYDIHKDDFYTSDEEHDCRYYCEFYGNHLDVYQDIDKNSDYRIGLVFNKKQECVDYFIDRITDGNIDYDVQEELSPYNREIFRIAEDKIKNLVLEKIRTQGVDNISINIDWSGFTEEMFNKFKNELLTGKEKPDWKGSINVGSVSIEISQYEKTEENPWLDYKVFILGEDNGYEYDGKGYNNSIPYAFYQGNQFAINMITDNTYEQFKEKFTNLIIDDLKENNIQNSEHVKKEMMRPTIDWNNYETSKKLYLDKIIEKIEWKYFSKESFELLKKEILSGNIEEGFKGKLNCGALAIEFHQHDKEYNFVDFDYYTLGEEGEGEVHNVPYCYESGETINHQLIKENDYKNFKKDFTNILSKEIEKHQFLKEATKYKTIDWADVIEVKNFYLEELNGKNFFKTETLSNANELKFIINSLEPSLDFKNSDAEIVLDYLLYGDYLSFENNTLKYKGDDGKAYGENLFDVLNYIEAIIEEHIENITMNIEYDSSPEEEQNYLKILKEQVLPSIQNKCNILRLKEIFKDKSSDMAFNGLEKANFDELYLDCKNSFPSKTDEELLVEAASRMIMSNVNEFGYFNVQNYDELFEKEDGADYRFALCEAAAKELIDRKIRDFSQVEEYIKNQSKEVFKNECLKELEKQTFLDDVEKIVDLSIDSLDKDDYLDAYSYVTEEEYDRTKYLFDNFYKIENQTGSIDLNALYDSKESIDNVVTLENGAEIRKIIESDEGEEREYYDLYDKDFCSICDGENYEVKAEINGTFYLKGLDSEYEDSGFALSSEEYLIATQRLGLLIKNQIFDINVWEETYDCGCLNDEIAEKLFDNYKEAEGYNDVVHIFAEKNEDGSFEYHLDRHNSETGEWKESLSESDIPQILINYLQKEIELFETKEKSLQHEKEVEVLWNKGILLFKDTKYWEDILTETPTDSKENENLILSKLHSKFRQEIVDKFNPNENINWENESWNYICETMQRKNLDYDYCVNYVNELTSKDLQDFIACDFITIKMNLHDKEMESLWEELEDIPFIEDEDGRLILDSDEPWHNFVPGTTKEEIWHYFDINHSKGINYLVNEYESKPNESSYLEYFFDNEPSLISWKEILSFNQDEPISLKQLKELLDDITEDNSSLSEKEQKEEVLFRLLDNKFDWLGFDYSLIDEGKIDSGKFLDTRCYCLEQIAEGIVSKKIENFEEAQTMLNELLLNDNHAKAFVIGKENNPLKILEEESKLSENISTFFRTQLLEEMKTTNNPFVASQRIVQELTKTNPDRLEELNSYFFENGCTSKKGFEKFFSNVIGLTKNKPIISKTKKEKDIEPKR